MLHSAHVLAARPAAPLSPVALLVLVGMAAVLHVKAGLLPGGFLETGRLLDTDSWTRAQRVLDLWQGAGWFDETLARLNAPQGLSLHWTRPLDVMILLPAKALNAAFGFAPRDAVLLAGAWVCPVLHACCGVAAALAARAVWTGVGPLLAGLLVIGNPAALSYSALGRADHHTLVLLAGLLALGAAARAAAEPGARRAAWWAGAFGGMGVWVSPEALLVAVPVLAGFGVVWVAEGTRGFPGRGAAAQGLRASLGFTLVAMAAVASEHHPSGWLRGEYDKVSAQHVLMGALSAAVFAAVGRLPGGAGRRALAGGSAAAVAACALLALWPQALRASMGGVDAGAAEHLIPDVHEMKPIDLSLAGLLDEAPMMLAAALAASLAFALSIPAWRRNGTLAVAVPLGLALAVTLPAAVRHIRFAVDLAAPAGLLAAGLPGFALGLRRPPLRFAVAFLAVFAAFGVPMLSRLGGSAPDGAAAAEVSGKWEECGAAALEALRRDGGTTPDGGGATAPVLLANTVNLGPELAWRTPFRLVAAPYHRGGEAFVDTAAFFTARDDAQARSIAAKRQVSMVLLCAPPPRESVAETVLLGRLRRGEAPDWMRPVPLPGAPAGVRLFSVLPTHATAAAAAPGG